MKLRLFLLFGILIPNLFFGQGTWIPFSSPAPKNINFNLIRSDNLSISFAVDVPGMLEEDTVVGGLLYKKIQIPGMADFEMNEGFPQIPFICKMIAIPECDSISITYNTIDTYNYNDILLFPRPTNQIIEDTNGFYHFEDIFTKNDSIYSLNCNMPALDYKIQSTGYFRSQKYLELIIYPIKYNPAEQELTVNFIFEININFFNSGSLIANTGIFNNIASHIFLNYPSNGVSALINDKKLDETRRFQWISLTDTSQAKDIVADYLIITDGQFFQPNDPEAALIKIADHRSFYNGFDVAVVNVQNIFNLDFIYSDPEYINEQKIRSFIKRVYEGNHAFHLLDGKLGYVLLVGDAIKGEATGVPSSYDPQNGASAYGEAIPNDYYFTCVTKNDEGDYDWEPDLFIGRFPAQNPDQLNNIIDKTVYYETECSFDDWRKTMLHYNYGPGYPSHMNEAYAAEFYRWLQEDLLPPNYVSNLKIVNGFEEESMDPFFDSINEGCFIASYQGHGSEHMLANSVSYNIDQHHNHLNNVNKCPFSTYFACATAWFDRAGDDCIVEDLIRYSNNKGYVGILACPRLTSYIIDYHIDDPPGGIPELIWYSIFKNNNFIVGEFIEEAKLLQPWMGDPRASHRFRLQLFGDPALNIMASGYEISSEAGMLPCEYEISNKIFIRDGGHLILGDCDYFLRDNGQIIVDAGGLLTINPKTKVYGENATNKIQIYGDIYFKPNEPPCQGCPPPPREVTFTSVGSDLWQGLELLNSTANITLEDITFINCDLTSYISELYVNHCTFTNSSVVSSSGFCSITNGSSFSNGGVSHSIGTLIITNSTFNPGSVNARNAGDPTKLVWMQNCNFIGGPGLGSPPISIEHYHNFYINNCDILSPPGCSGITIINSGELGTRYNDISNCDITCRMDENCYSETGIVLYNSRANVKNNNIYNNCYGLKLLNRAASTIQGTMLFQSEEVTQRIKNNHIAQLYITQDAFPSYLHWNTIYDSYSATVFIYYTDPRPPMLNVENNYWGRNYNPYPNLFPYGYYDYTPMYSPPFKDEDLIESIYNEAIINADSGFYQPADSLLKSIIDQYPESKYALFSVKDLFWLNKSWNNNYVSLKTYLNSIELDSNLIDVVDFISNKCDIELGNYAEAINWYDSIIQNPVSMEDSICAIIDLMDLSLTIDQDSTFQKSSNLQINSAYKPKDYVDYTTKRKVLIDLLGTKNDNQNLEMPPLSDTLSANSNYIECFPNPFSNTTEVHFNVNCPSFIKIDLYDIYGRVVSKITDKFYSEGKYVITLNKGGTSKGIYIIKLNVNDQIKGSKKIVIE